MPWMFWAYETVGGGGFLQFCPPPPPPPPPPVSGPVPAQPASPSASETMHTATQRVDGQLSTTGGGALSDSVEPRRASRPIDRARDRRSAGSAATSHPSTPPSPFQRRVHSI